MCIKRHRVPRAERRENSSRPATSTRRTALFMQSGAGLIELVIFIVVVSLALVGVLLVMNQTTGHSADALLRKQALTVAEALLEEIEQQPFSGAFSGPNTQANRPLFDNVFNYHGFATSGVFPANGALTGVPGLNNYNVAATVVLLSAAWGSIPAASAAQITVTVTDPAGQVASVTGFRTNY